MTAKQFNTALVALGIESHMAAAAVLGCGRRSIIRYAQGEAEVPESLRRLIVMLVRHGAPKEWE